MKKNKKAKKALNRCISKKKLDLEVAYFLSTTKMLNWYIYFFHCDVEYDGGGEEDCDAWEGDADEVGGDNCGGEEPEEDCGGDDCNGGGDDDGGDDNGGGGDE